MFKIDLCELEMLASVFSAIIHLLEMESALKRESNIIEGPHTVLSSLLQFFISVILTFQTSQLILS